MSRVNDYRRAMNGLRPSPAWRRRTLAAMEEAARVMAEAQVRRLPVVEEGKLVGIISLADLARSQRFDMEAAQALGEISENIVRR